MPINGLFIGTEAGTPTSQPLGAVSFDYAIGRISTLLGRAGALGVRFHFNRPRPENPTALYAAACGESRDILDSDNAANDDYFKPDGTAVAESRLPDIISAATNPKANACVFFSRALLDGYIQNPQVVALRLYVVGFGAQVVGVTPNLSLVSVGINSAGQPVGPFLLSEEPCPPNCPMGYP
ncbi:MAG: hypothetical protein ACKVUS_07360 [Saprospiraceae bacterium]